MAAANHLGGLKTTINSCKSNQWAETVRQNIIEALVTDKSKT